MFSRRSFLAWLPAFLGGVAAVPWLVEAAESVPPPLPTTACSRFTRAFTIRLEACCHQQGKTLDDLVREFGTFPYEVRPERLVPMCCEDDKWLLVVHRLAEILDVRSRWLLFGEDEAARWRWMRRCVSTRCLASPLKVLP